jgi:hypothetical protein
MNLCQARWFNAFTATAVSVLLIHGVLLTWMAFKNAPMFDEIALLPAGISHWQLASFDLYCVNPPLPRMCAAIPILFAGAETNWSDITRTSFSRPEFTVGTRFTQINGRRSLWLFTLARWACIPFSVLGGWVCFRWATELFGQGPGVVATVLWSFCPNILAWGSTITPDSAAAATGVMAGYNFWRWLKKPSWTNAAIAGTALGIAELSKTTWIILFILWPLLWFIARFRAPLIRTERIRARDGGQLITILLTGLYLINLGYGFEGSFRRLRDFDFVSATLGGEPGRQLAGNRFRQSILGSIPIPVPANYLRGIDVQKSDFEVGKWSYLRGEQKLGGWYHYYCYGLAVKTPLGTIALAVLAIVLACASTRYRLPWRDEVIVIAPAVVILLLVSSQTGFNRYLRYVLPALPFMFVSISRVGRCLNSSPRMFQVLVTLLLISSAIGSLRVFPHSMSYFNSFAGGPVAGHTYLMDANLDWGQDLTYLKDWLDAHPAARPFHLQYFGYLRPEIAGVYALPVPPGPTAENTSLDPTGLGPQVGWHAVSVSDVFGYRHYGKARDQFKYFQQLKPVAFAGYSIYIYFISEAEANQLRRALGLPPLTAGCSSSL